jgi:hypothetical protein
MNAAIASPEMARLCLWQVYSLEMLSLFTNAERGELLSSTSE